VPRLAKILIRQGTTTPAAGDFDVAEPAWDKSAGKLYIKNAAGSMVEIGTGGGGGSLNELDGGSAASVFTTNALTLLDGGAA
jgi:hypothetical protein